MTPFHQSLLAQLASLRGFARYLCRGAHWSEDLVQETLIIALRLEKSFSPGTNLRAWLFALMKNAYRNESRKARLREKVLVAEECGDDVQTSAANQENSVALSETLRAIKLMSKEHQEVLLIVSVYEMSYSEAAKVLDVPVGTVRSRLARARQKLALILGNDNEL